MQRFSWLRGGYFFRGVSVMAKIRSLRLQLTIVIVAITVVLTLIMGVMNIQSINIYSTQVANTGLNWKTQREASHLDKMMLQSQDAVDFAANTAQQNFTSKDQLQDPAFRADIKIRLHRQFQAAVRNIPEVSGFYLHFNEDLLPEPDGFFYQKLPGRTEFQEEPIAHPKEGPEEEAQANNLWYYEPMEKLSPVWIPPYQESPNGPRIISYTKPIFVNRRCIGLVGIDIRMDTLIGRLKNVHIYDSGYALLFSAGGELYYHPDHPYGLPDTNLSNFGLSQYQSLFRQHDSGSDTLPVFYKKEQKQLAFTTLVNGMKLGVEAPSSEIYAVQRTATFRAFFLLILFAICGSSLAAYLANKFLQPLAAINKAASRMGQGNYDIPVSYESQDEIGQLARNINKTMGLMKTMVQGLKTEAFQDKLTHVKNVSALETRILDLDGRITEKDPQLAFGVVMVDCNGLKGINDTYGHEKGNLLLQLTAKTICDVYAHSPVYRIGGDEFLVLLQNRDYENREALWQQLLPYLRKRDWTGEKPWEQLSFSAGHAEYQPGSDISFTEVFRRADGAMYQVKRSIEGDAAR